MKVSPLYFRRGVTLIELLVAVGLIIVLASLLLPVFRAMRKATNSTKCISHLRTTGGMLRMAIADSNQRLVSRAGGNTLAGHYMWPDLLWRRGYLSPDRVANTTPGADILKVLRCPSAPCSPNVWYWYTYGLNMNDSRTTLELQGQNKDARIFELNASRIEEPASYLLIADSISSNGETQTFRIGAKPTFSDGIELRHNGRAYAYFLDGHVSALDREAAEELGISNIYDVVRTD